MRDGSDEVNFSSIEIMSSWPVWWMVSLHCGWQPEATFTLCKVGGRVGGFSNIVNCDNRIVRKFIREWITNDIVQSHRLYLSLKNFGTYYGDLSLLMWITRQKKKKRKVI